jgi:hypothetical protein
MSLTQSPTRAKACTGKQIARERNETHLFEHRFELRRKIALDELTLRKFLPNNDWYKVKAIYLFEAGLSNCDIPPPFKSMFEKVDIVYLSRNLFTSVSISSVWRSFPEAWWVDLSSNNIESLGHAELPAALGSLNLSRNSFDITELSLISHVHIFRLFIHSWIGQLSIQEVCFIIVQMLHVWVMNEEYISWYDRAAAKAFISRFNVQSIVQQTRSTWKPSRFCRRESTILHCMQRLMTADTDYLRLDILLEDYIHEAITFNDYAASISSCKSFVVKRLKPMPVVHSMHSLLNLQHRHRLDLSVLLTASVIFEVPVTLFCDAVSVLMPGILPSEVLYALPLLPSFARTALVSLLRRACRKEQQDLQCFNRLKTKPINQVINVAGAPQADSIPYCSYETAEDFYFLRCFKEFFEDQLTDSTPLRDIIPMEQTQPFSELEEEILAKLPDCPTKLSAKKFDALDKPGHDANSYNSWVSFAARHTIFLITKSPSCPPLTRVAASSAEQELYWKLLPLLQAAEMTLTDLEVVSADACSHGRDIKDRSKLIVARKGAKMSRHATQLAMAMSTLGQHYLPFGMGLPKASISSLRWRGEDAIVNRGYEQPWKPSMGSHGVLEATADIAADGMFFVTEQGERAIEPSGSPKARLSARAPVYRISTESNADIGSMPAVDLQARDTVAMSPSAAFRLHSSSPQSPNMRASLREEARPVHLPVACRPQSGLQSSLDLKILYSPAEVLSGRQSPPRMLSEPSLTQSQAELVEMKPASHEVSGRLSVLSAWRALTMLPDRVA